ncbi:MAG: hypothetical protein H6838_06000 [Planctomycetes bacterium]|nr:hypothetical protein [Planctomycetota bacterium]MCB9885024.1 hypothetical protein [Planctomycetota bacterium]
MLRPVPTCLLLVLTACVAKPELEEPVSATTGARSLLAEDFSKAAFARRTNNLADRSVDLFTGEFRGFHSMSWERLVSAPDRRLDGLGRTGGKIADLAARRRFTHAENLAEELSLPHAAHDVSETLASMPILLATDRQPMGEIDDKRHRTDPFDDSPEASLLDRLLRRLRL